MLHVRKDFSLALPALRWLFQFVLPLAVGVGLIVVVIWLSRLARDDLRRRGEHIIAFADIECLPPEGMTRAEFLDEARSLSGLPERFDALEERTADRIRSALAAHPWVARVRGVKVSGDRASAEVEYRVPVLWVEESERAVDGDGVLLPVSARRKGLAVLAGKVAAPAGRPGQPWGDAAVEAAAKVVAVLWPERKVIDLSALRVAVAGGVVRMRRGVQQRIMWGRPPGQEQPGEPDAAAKLTRLLKAVREGGEVDLRR